MFNLTQEMIDALFPLLYANKNDPGPAAAVSTPETVPPAAPTAPAATAPVTAPAPTTPAAAQPTATKP